MEFSETEFFSNLASLSFWQVVRNERKESGSREHYHTKEGTVFSTLSAFRCQEGRGRKCIFKG